MSLRHFVIPAVSTLALLGGVMVPAATSAAAAMPQTGSTGTITSSSSGQTAAAHGGSLQVSGNTMTIAKRGNGGLAPAVVTFTCRFFGNYSWAESYSTHRPYPLLDVAWPSSSATTTCTQSNGAFFGGTNMSISIYATRPDGANIPLGQASCSHCTAQITTAKVPYRCDATAAPNCAGQWGGYEKAVWQVPSGWQFNSTTAGCKLSDKSRVSTCYTYATGLPDIPPFSS